MGKLAGQNLFAHTAADLQAFGSTSPIAATSDGIPNIGEVNLSSHQQWHIPAIHTSPKSQGAIVNAARFKAGAAIKMGRRRAWLRFLAYEGCMQVCLESLLSSNEGSQTAATFLSSHCGLLKAGLGVDGLVLAPHHELSIYWDDKEEDPLQAETLELLEAAAAVAAAAGTHAQQAEPIIEQPPIKAVERGPCVEARVVRVVGCDALLQATGEQTFHAVLYPSDKHAEQDGAWTLVSTDGSTHQHEAIQFAPDQGAPQLTVELQSDGASIATGSVQVTELAKLARRRDEEYHSSSGGFFSKLFGGRKSKSWSSQSNMTWVALLDTSGKTCGHVVVSARDGNADKDSVAYLAPQSHGGCGFQVEEITSSSSAMVSQQTSKNASPDRSPFQLAIGALNQGRSNTAPQHIGSSAGILQANAPAVYDELLSAALSAQGCGPRNLAVAGGWGWLLQRFAAAYEIRPNHAALSYLRWLLHPDNATVTADCLEAAMQQLATLKAAQADNALSSSELSALHQVCIRVEQLLAACFENYFMLSEDAPRGVVEGGPAARSAAPPALKPAVGLFSLIRDPRSSADQEWLADRFSVAARQRYQGLLTAAELTQPTNTHETPEASAARAYARLEHVCRAVCDELRADEAIHEAGILPTAVHLPAITAGEYTAAIAGQLRRLLQQYPPPAPTQGAIRLVESVGKLLDFILRHGYTEAAGKLNARELFGQHVTEWISTSASGLRQAVSALDASTPSTATTWQDFSSGPGKVAPMIEEMLRAIECEMMRYEKIISYWPMYAPELEAAVTSAMRKTIAAASHRCGLVQKKESGTLALLPDSGNRPLGGQIHSSPGQTQRAGRLAWCWVQLAERPSVPTSFRGTVTCLQQGITPRQALLLNSLRRLLAAAPQLEYTLGSWCTGFSSGAPNSARKARLVRDAPDLGAHFAQLVKELRSEYFAAITLCAEKLAGELTRLPQTSVAAILKREGMHLQPHEIVQELGLALGDIQKVLQWLAAALDGRVFVALTRGLWDLTARDILEYAEDLTEGSRGGAWRGRQNASSILAVVDKFFSGALTGSMRGELQDKDLALPQHSDRAHKLLDTQGKVLQMSYDVY